MKNRYFVICSFRQKLFCFIFFLFGGFKNSILSFFDIRIQYVWHLATIFKTSFNIQHIVCLDKENSKTSACGNGESVSTLVVGCYLFYFHHWCPREKKTIVLATSVNLAYPLKYFTFIIQLSQLNTTFPPKYFFAAIAISVCFSRYFSFFSQSIPLHLQRKYVGCLRTSLQPIFIATILISLILPIWTSRSCRKKNTWLYFHNTSAVF